MFVGTAELPKGSFAKLQPLSSEFAQLDVSPKELLERTLARVNCVEPPRYFGREPRLYQFWVRYMVLLSII